MSKEATKGIEKIRKLDVKQRELEKSADQILATSGVGQAPPVYHRELDKVTVIQKQKAEIWNEIRGHIVNPANKTLWQLAIEEYPVVRFGQEKHLGIYAEDIDKLLAQPPSKPEAVEVAPEVKTCRNCKAYRSCARALKRMQIDPDDPNNEAIKLCVRWRPRAGRR